MAAEKVILSWNFENWLTVILMAAIGFMGIGALQKWYASRQGA